MNGNSPRDRIGRRRRCRRRGAILVAALMLLLVVSLIAVALTQRMVAAHRQLRWDHQQLQAVFLADAGEELAVRQLTRSAAYDGETWRTPLGDGSNHGVVIIRVESLADAAAAPQADGSAARRIVVEALVPENSSFQALVRRERPWPPAEGESP